MDRIRQYVRKLRSVLRRQGRTREDADDLIQEAFLRLHTYCKSAEIRQQEAYLTRTVLNLSVDMHRKERRERYVDQPVDTLVLTDLSPTPHDDLVAQERLARVAAVLESLSPRTREIFLMHRLEGYGCAQIAKHFAISVSAVEKHIARAVLALMDIVELR